MKYRRLRFPQISRVRVPFPLTIPPSVDPFFGELLSEQPGGLSLSSGLCLGTSSAEYPVSLLTSFTFYRVQGHQHSLLTVTATLGQARAAFPTILLPRSHSRLLTGALSGCSLLSPFSSEPPRVCVCVTQPRVPPLLSVTPLSQLWYLSKQCPPFGTMPYNNSK